MKISIEYIGVPAADSAALKNWYESVLGAKPVFDNDPNPPTCLISPGSAWLEIYAAEASLKNRDNNKLAGFRHLARRVDSIEAARFELENAA